MTERRETSCPEEVLEWIAWYPEGTLPDHQRGLVEAHASECMACRQELALVRGDASDAETPLPDMESVFERVLARIEEDQLGDRVVPLPGAGAAARGPRAARRGMSQGSRGGWIAAAAGLVLSLGVAGTWFSQQADGPGGYETATARPEAAAPAAGASLDVRFRDDATSVEIQNALWAVDAQVVRGPTPSGFFRIQLSEKQDPENVVSTLQADGRGVALFAQPSLP